LTDTSELLNALLQCSRDYGNYRAGGGNPFGGGGSSGSSNPFGGGAAPAPANPFGGGSAPRPAPADKKTGETI
ncbi:MAG TPA: hypothetical protein PLE50_04055, partial [Rhabdaerophilum sp.]|nr:hypothetical protein [Rhabdaerophilum sp.]